MSKTDKEEPQVTEKLCESRRETIREEIDGIKKTIYTTSLAITVVIVVVQLILTLVKR